MDLPSMSGLNVILLGSITAIFISLISSLKEYPKKLFGFLYDRFVFKATIYNQDSFYYVVENWLALKYPNSYRDISIVSVSKNQKEENQKIKTFGISNIKNEIFVKHQGKWILILKNREKMEYSTQSYNGYIDYYVFLGCRARKQIIQLFTEILKTVNSEKSDFIEVYQNDDWNWRKTNVTYVKKLDNIYLDDNVKEEIVKNIEEFISSEQWYVEKGIPYKRTILLHGGPGNGKTSISLGLAQHFNRDVYYMSLNTLSNDNQLREVFSKLREESVLLIEDCDKLFSNRDASGHKVSFSAFINCLDGALYKRNLITILTTNHIENLDEALLREGRIDLKYEIHNPSCIMITNYVQNFYSIKNVKIVRCNKSMARIQEICISNKNDSVTAIKLINS